MLTADAVLEIYRKFKKYENPAADAVQELADVAAQSTPSDVWNTLRGIDAARFVDEIIPWVESSLIDNAQESTSVYFLLWDTELRPKLHGQDLYVHTAEVKLDPTNYEEWEKVESEDRSQCSAFEWIAERLPTFEAVNGYSDYAIPLVLAGGVVYEAINTLCASGGLKDAKGLRVGAGYRWGDAFSLGEVGNTRLVPNLKRLA